MLINPRENPFPGMNPFMEDPRSWQGIHSQIINIINLEINQTLPLEYATRIEERVYVENSKKDYIPDSFIVQRQSAKPVPAGSRGGQTAVMEREEIAASDFSLPLTIESEEETIKEPFLEIRSRTGNHELIAVIEVLSPANKGRGQGRTEYKSKQEEMVRSRVHFLEIDLLRGGQYTLAPDENRLRYAAKTWGYLVGLHRAGDGAKHDCWPVSLRERLPRLLLPLETQFVPLDLQTLVDRVYSEGGFWRSAEYDAPPVPPLGANDEAWADALLREKGLRP